MRAQLSSSVMTNTRETLVQVSDGMLCCFLTETLPEDETRNPAEIQAIPLPAHRGQVFPERKSAETEGNYVTLSMLSVSYDAGLSSTLDDNPRLWTR